MSQTDNILNQVKDIVVEKLKVKNEEIIMTPATKLADDLGADSLDTIELVMAIEEKFDIKIPDKDAEEIVTLADAVEFIESAINKE